MTQYHYILTLTNVSSVLLRTIISKAPIGTHDKAIIRPETCEELGRLCFAQLVELRHRGAFSTVAQTFASFCRRCLSTDHQVLRKLPEKWYQVWTYGRLWLRRLTM